MTKTELTNRVVAKMADRYQGLTKKALREISTAILEEIAEALRQGEEVRIPGFATFHIRKRKGERLTIFNLQTGQKEIITLRRNIVGVRVSKKAR